jgi:hypothetical protein
MQDEKDFRIGDWLDEMLRGRPSLVPELQSHGITSALTYMKFAETLPIEILDEVERFRFTYLLPSVDRDNPFQLVGIAPAWLLNVGISQLELTVRCQNVLEREEIETVAELRNYQMEEALHWKQFGKRSALDLSSALLGAIKAGAQYFGLRLVPISDIRNEMDETWFEDMVGEQPALIAELALSGIDSASTYMKKREALSNEALDGTEEFRFAHALRTINADDPFQLVRKAPLWLLSVPVNRLELTARCANALEKESIEIVGDLSNHQLDEALRWKNFGKKSARDLSIGLQSAMKQGAQHFRLASALDKLIGTETNESYKDASDASQGILETPPSTSLREDLLDALGGLTERVAIVFQGRLMTHPRQTLGQIGYQLGLSRERVRQLEDRYLRILEKRHFFPMLIGLKVSRLFRARTTPLYLDAIHEEDSWFDGFSNETEKLGTLIRAFSEWSTFESDNRIIVSAIGEDDFYNLKRKALESLRNAEPMSLKRTEVEALLAEFAIQAGAAELGGVLSAALRDQLHYTSPIDANEPMLSGVGWGVNHTVIAVLNEAERPLHFSELTRRCSDRLGREVEERRVHSVLITDNAQYYGRGTYGTNKHFPFGQDLKDEIRSEVESVMLSNRDRQWHAGDLVDLLADRRPDLPEEVDQYIVNIILEESTVLRALGRLVWTVRGDMSSDLVESVNRIDLMQACIAILEIAGKPMPLDEIRLELKKQRGVGKYFVLQSSKALARIRPNTWGLVSRDFFVLMYSACDSWTV